LDNIFLTQETIFHAKQSNKPLLFLKLDFSKAYDKVDLSFMFQALHMLGFPQLFIRMVRLFIEKAVAKVSVNGRTTSAFQILQGIRQRCSLAPYLFLVIGKILNHCIKREAHREQIKGIELLRAVEPQIIVQFVDDTSLSFATEESSMSVTCNTLSKFCPALGLLINEGKSAAYYWLPRGKITLDGLISTNGNGLPLGKFPNF
jgi:hypothetical protein